MDRQPIQEQAQRLKFQMAAAQVQFDLSGLLRQVQAVLTDVYDGESWSQKATKLSADFIAMAHIHIDRWRQLSPPPELQPHWEEILRAFEPLGPLLEAFASLKDAPPGELRRRLAGCQSEFIEWLKEANEAEQKLAERESELAAPHADI